MSCGARVRPRWRSSIAITRIPGRMRWCWIWRLGKKSRALTCAGASVAGAAGRAACSRTCTAWPTSWESPAARRCWTHAPDTICSAPAFRPAWPAACRASGDRGVLRRIVRGGARGVRVLDGGTGPRHRDRARYHVGSGCACRPGRRHVPPGPVPVAGACHGRNPHAGCPDGHAGTDGMPADEHEYQQQLDELRDAASRAMGHTHEVIDSLEEHTPAQASRTPNKPTGSWRPSFPLPACYRQWNGDVRVPVVGIIGDVERPGHGFDNGSVSLEAAAESEPYRFVL